MSSLLSSHPISLLLLAQQRIERYLRLQELGKVWTTAESETDVTTGT